MSQYFIEIGEDKSKSSCSCCNSDSYVGHGFVYKNDIAYAVYYVGWSEFHVEKKATFAIAIGEWSEESNSSDRTCFGLDVIENDEEVLLRFIDPSESPWPETDLLGVMLSRDVSLKNMLAKEIFEIVGEILRIHPSLMKYLMISKS